MILLSEPRIRTTIDEGRVKLHIFEPSKRRLWTVVGKGKEHWLDPDLNFCSCPAFYFGNISESKPCYHLKSVKIAQKENRFETIIFSDDEFSEFVYSLLSDL